MLLITLISSFSVLSQPVKFEPVTYNITTEHGLPSMETYSVKQDSKGFIWICTDGGVSRYDGFEFKNYTIADGLTDNVVFDIYEDFKGRIWFLTYNSLLCYYENDKIHRYKFNNKIAEIANEPITSKFLLIDSLGNLFYSLKFKGMFKIDSKGNYKQLQSDPYGYFTLKIEKNILLSMRMDEKKNLPDGLENLNFNGHVPRDTKKTITSTTSFCFPVQTHNINNNFASFNNCIYNIQEDKIIFFDEDIISFKVIDGFFWVCTLNGLLKAKLDESGNLKIVNTYFDGLQISSIEKIDNSYFVSSIENGVFVCFDFDFLKTNNSLGLIKGSILSITKFKNHLYATTSGEIQSLTENCIIDIGISRKSSRKIFNYQNELLVFSSYSDFKPRINKELKLKINCFEYAKDVKFYHDEIFYVGEEVFAYNHKTNKLDIICDGYMNGSLKRQRALTSVVILPNKEVLVGNSRGVFKINNEKLEPYDVGIEHISVSTLDYNKNWGLIIGTQNDGVYFIKSGVISHFNKENGLLTNKVNAITISGNIVFVGTSEGLNILTLKNGKIINNVYSSYDFLSNLDINFIYLDNQNIYLATTTGIVKLNLKTLLNKKVKSNQIPICIKDVFIDGYKSSNSKIIYFPYSANLLKIDFSVLQFTNWKDKKYQYRVSSSNQWIDIESPRITILQPNGVLDIEVRYMNSDFSWSVPQKLCKVRVMLPFWQRWYFWTFIAFGGLIFFFYLYQRNQQRVVKKLLQENNMLSLEQQMQNARMNPHFIFNVLNSIHSYVLNEDTEKADVYLMKFSKLMREILFSTKEGKISIQHETSILNKYLELEQLRFKHSFDFEVIYEDEMDDLAIPSMMIQPFVENAVLYSNQIDDAPKMSIVVRFEQLSSSLLKVSITNSGIPTLEAQEKMNKSNTKNAIGITRKRLENYNKLFHSSDYGIELFVVDEKETRIELKIPIFNMNVN